MDTPTSPYELSQGEHGVDVSLESIGRTAWIAHRDSPPSPAFAGTRPDEGGNGADRAVSDALWKRSQISQAIPTDFSCDASCGECEG